MVNEAVVVLEGQSPIQPHVRKSHRQARNWIEQRDGPRWRLPQAPARLKSPNAGRHLARARIEEPRAVAHHIDPEAKA